MAEPFEQIVRRRSIREYTDEPLDAMEIARILEAARLAPSAVNLQPTRVLVVTEPDDLAAVRSASYGIGACASAPCVFVCMANLEAEATLGERVGELVESKAMEPMDLSKLASGLGRPFELKVGREVAIANCAVAVAYMDLQATALGLGACWVHHADFDEIRQHFGIPDSLEIIALLPVGHPAERPGPRPRIPTIEWKPTR